jgi:hypothetical protein
MLVKSAEVIGWALGGLEREIAETKQRLATLTAQASKLRASVGARGRSAAAAAASDQGGPAAGTRRRRRRMSPEARKRISDMMKKRWAERKKGSK